MQQEQLIQGRLVGPADLAFIRNWLSAHPSGNRTGLSRELCTLWGWRNHVGRLKDMAARSLLLQLEARGQISLPPRRAASINSLRNRTLVAVPHDQSPIRCPLATLRPLQLQGLSEQSGDLALFKFLLERYHYLGLRNGVGENFKYLVRDRWGRLLACLLFGSASWHLRPRDAWIGWNREQRRRHLFLLTNNKRFLILPWVEVPELASHLLSLVTARLSQDWQEKYGHPIHLLETFVERERFAATCYGAAGWFHAGTTIGRTRTSLQQTPKEPLKEVYLKPLVADFRRRLTA
jgi:hypothetical protein